MPSLFLRSQTYSFHHPVRPYLQLRRTSTQVLNLSILNFTLVKPANFLFIQICFFSSELEKHPSRLQNLPPGLSRTLCNFSCILSIFAALLLLRRPWLKSLLPLPNDWNNVSSHSSSFFAWSHFKHCQSHLLKHSSSFIRALCNLHGLPSGLAWNTFPSGIIHSS